MGRNVHKHTTENVLGVQYPHGEKCQKKNSNKNNNNHSVTMENSWLKGKKSESERIRCQLNIKQTWIWIRVAGCIVYSMQTLFLSTCLALNSLFTCFFSLFLSPFMLFCSLYLSRYRFFTHCFIALSPPFSFTLPIVTTFSPQFHNNCAYLCLESVLKRKKKAPIQHKYLLDSWFHDLHLLNINCTSNITPIQCVLSLV